MKNKVLTSLAIITAITLTIIFERAIFIIVSLLVPYYLYFIPLNKKRNQVKQEKSNLHREFITYAKNIILLSYTRTIKESIKQANYGMSETMSKKINVFLTDIEYNFTVQPYIDFANEINPNQDDINYEKHIMIMFFELSQKGTGTEYVDDLISEIQKLEDNSYSKKIYTLKQEEWKYNIIPTIINFVYISFVLMQIINDIMQSIFTT